MSDTFDPIAFLSAVSGDGDWSDEFLAWYQPGAWLSDERACAAFIAEKFVRLQAERDAGGPAATGRALAAQAPQAAEPENPHERDDFRQLCRELDVRGTAMEAVCGAFWIRGAAAQPLTTNYIALADKLAGYAAGDEFQRPVEEAERVIRAIEPDRKDALRYRWLRDVRDAKWRPFGIRAGYSAEQANAAIDAAIAARQAPKEPT